MQSILLRDAWQLKQDSFRRSVLTAMTQVSQKLVTDEVMQIAISLGDSTRAHATATIMAWSHSIQNVEKDVLIGESAIQFDTCMSPSFNFTANGVNYFLPTDQNVRLVVVDSSKGSRQVLIDTFAPAGNYDVPVDLEKFESNSYEWHYETDSVSLTVNMSHYDSSTTYRHEPDSGSARVVVVKSLISDDIFSRGRYGSGELDSLKLDSLIGVSLHESDIDLDYSFLVLGIGNDSIYLARPTPVTEQLTSSGFRTPLIPHNLFSIPADLILYFPGYNAYLLGQIWPLFLPTAILILIIVGCFVYTIRTILSQRRFASTLVDFINNMTHEFKTPISTVQLACEAIARPDVVVDQKQVLRFNSMIQNENQRMRNQTDKILQMAVLEEGDYELKYEDVDLHDIICKAAEAVALHVENRKGTIECHLEAQRHTISADRVHITGIIGNILDNANKYSPELPKLIVKTRSDDWNVIIEVTDNGIGMNDENRKQVFDKYFRVSSGNVHDVKGFGIGLSYVKLMTLAHKGQVSLKSVRGEGTTVTVILPITRTAGKHT